MTAIQMIQTDKAAIMVSDTAMIRRETGEVSEFTRKHVLVNHARLAFGVTGRGGLGPLIAEIAQYGPSGATQDDFIAFLPKAARTVREGYGNEWPHDDVRADDGRALNDFTIFLAMFTEFGPLLLAMATNRQSTFGDAAPYEWTECGNWSQPGYDAATVLPEGWRGVRDCRRIIEAQRQEPFEPHGHSAVGGEAFASIITRTGATEKRIRRWSDVVGEPIRVDRP